MNDDLDEQSGSTEGDRRPNPASTAPVQGHLAVRSLRGPAQRTKWTRAAAAAVVVVAFALIQLSGSQGSPAPGSVATSKTTVELSMSPSTYPATPHPVPVTTLVPTPMVASNPSWTLDLAGQLECEGLPANIGGETGEVLGEAESPDSPEAALAVFAATTMYTSLPATGYERTDLVPHWARFVHRADRRIKAIVVIGDGGEYRTPGTWSVVGLRACDASEFATGSGFTGATLTVWLDADDRRVPTTRIHETRGPDHCNWESTTWLRLEDGMYIRDPDLVLTGATVTPFDPDVVLPGGAASTGYHEAGREIWRDADPDAIYVVLSNQVERWPRATDDLACM